MKRFEITGCATDVWTLAEIRAALKAAGAQRVSSRYAFGWHNQPHVTTFAADSEAEARRICDKARELISDEPFPRAPSLLPYAYAGPVDEKRELVAAFTNFVREVRA